MFQMGNLNVVSRLSESVRHGVLFRERAQESEPVRESARESVSKTVRHVVLFQERAHESESVREQCVSKSKSSISKSIIYSPTLEEWSLTASVIPGCEIAHS